MTRATLPLTHTCAELAREPVHVTDLDGARWRLVLDAFAEGFPKPEGSYKLGRQGYRKGGRPIVVPNDSPGLDGWRTTVGLLIGQAIGPRWGTRPLGGPLYCACSFRLPRRRREPDPPGPAIEHGLGDGDKLQRAVHDALTAAAVWTDDAVVTSGAWTKRRVLVGEATGVRVRVGVPAHDSPLL